MSQLYKESAAGESMKLYYFEYEPTVRTWFWDTEYHLYHGFLLETPLGVLEYFDEDEINNWNNTEEFKAHINRFIPRNFHIVELE